MRKKKLIARLIKALVVIFVLLAVVGAVYFLLSGKIDSVEKKTQSMEAITTKNNAEYERLKKEVANSKDAFEFFSNFQTTDDAKNDSFRRTNVVRILTQIKADLDLNSLSYKMEPFAELKEKTYKKNSAVTVKTDVTIEFGAVDDIRAMQLLREVEDRFPGHVYIKKFDLSKTRDQIDGQRLLDVSQGRNLDFVRGEIQFDWYAIRLLELEEKEGGDGA